MINGDLLAELIRRIARLHRYGVLRVVEDVAPTYLTQRLNYYMPNKRFTHLRLGAGEGYLVVRTDYFVPQEKQRKIKPKSNRKGTEK